MYTVYQIEHVPTGRRYVGCTRKSIEERFRRHARSRKSTHPLHVDMRHFGPNAFSITAICAADERESALIAEEKQMALRGSFYPVGYNYPARGGLKLEEPYYPPHPLVVDLQTRMFRARMKPNEIMKVAGVGRATWWRWTRGAKPNLSTLDRLVEAIEEREAQMRTTA